MVFTLQRYVFGELFRAFVLATIALTLMLSLGSILQPVQKYGVGPRQVLFLMTYLLPVTLTFVLPMAALFASALIYGRFASDNELTACRASGIHMMTLIYPGLALSIAVAIATLLLSFHVMPAFVQRAEKSFKDDARQILFRNIQRKGYYALPPEERILLYADNVNPADNTLIGVIVIKLSKNRATVEEMITADAARVNFRPHERFSEVQVTAYNTFQINADDDSGAGAEELTVGFEFGSMLEDEIKFKELADMKQIAVRPIDFNPIAKLSRRIYAKAAAELLAQEINRSTQAGRAYRLNSDTRVVEVMADKCEPSGEKRVALLGDIVVTEYNADTMEKIATMTSSKAYLHLEGDELLPTLTLDVYNARVDESAYLKMRHIIRHLVMPARVETVMSRFKDSEGRLDTEPLSGEITELAAGPSDLLALRQLQLRIMITKTLLEIKAELHSRLVFGIGCVPMILIGIGLGILKRGGHLLSAFGISCLPAAMLIICIMSGKQATENVDSSVSGIMIMWAGLGALGVITLGVYRKLFRT